MISHLLAALFLKMQSTSRSSPKVLSYPVKNQIGRLVYQQRIATLGLLFFRGSILCGLKSFFEKRLVRLQTYFQPLILHINWHKCFEN